MNNMGGAVSHDHSCSQRPLIHLVDFSTQIFFGGAWQLPNIAWEFIMNLSSCYNIYNMLYVDCGNKEMYNEDKNS